MRSGRLSFFAAASWLVPLFAFLMMIPYVHAVAERERGGWGPPPRFGAFIVQLGVTAGLAFSLGLLSIIRRERLSWIGAIPCIFGGLVFLPFVFIAFLNIAGGALRPMLYAPDLTVGIIMALNGVLFLFWLLPKASAHLARVQQADGIGEKEARMKTKTVKMFGIATLIVGVVLILIHALDLF